MSPISRVRRNETTRKPTLSGPAKRDRDRRMYLRNRRLRWVGWALMSIGAGVALEHAVAHLGAFGGQPSPLIDLTLGWPLAGLIFFVGAAFAGQRHI